MDRPLPPLPSLGRDRTIRWILLAALGVQVAVAVAAVGWWHPDQHFGIFEFASWRLGLTPASSLTWEFPHRVRQTLPVYLFLGLHKLLVPLHLDFAYTEQLILRLITSLLNLVLFNAIVLHTFRKDRRLTLYAVLLVLNFSWSFPYIRTLFTYEGLGGLAYFGGIFLYLRSRERGVTVFRALVVGFLLGTAFFLRFQLGFAMVGLGLWFVLFDRPPLRILALLFVGFLVAAGLNVWLDSAFYGSWTFTPWNYWKVNVIDGRSAGFGTSSVFYYIGLLALVFTAPILSVVLLGFFGRGLLKSLRNPYTLSVIPFLAAHFLVGHKEERFLFPIFGILPVILGYGLRDRLARLPDDARALWKSRTMKWVILPSAALNCFVLGVSCFVSPCLQVAFMEKLNDPRLEMPLHLVCLRQDPYTTGAGNTATYYVHARRAGISTEVAWHPAVFRKREGEAPVGTFFAAKYRHLAKYGLLDLLPDEVVMTSSALCWPIARRLHALTGWAQPELWVLWQKGPGSGGQPRG